LDQHERQGDQPADRDEKGEILAPLLPGNRAISGKTWEIAHAKGKSLTRMPAISPVRLRWAFSHDSVDLTYHGFRRNIDGVRHRDLAFNRWKKAIAPTVVPQPNEPFLQAICLAQGSSFDLSQVVSIQLVLANHALRKETP
jgi:hypothetical protein